MTPRKPPPAPPAPDPVEAPRRIEMVRLDRLARAPRNPKAHDLPLIGRSIDHFGVVELPAVDDRTGRLVAGHGRLDALIAAHQAGQTPPDGVTLDPTDGMWIVPTVAGWRSRSDDDAGAYVVTSNRATEVGGWNNDELLPMLGDLAAVDLLDVTGYNAGDVADLEALAAGSPADLAPAARPDVDDTAAYRTPENPRTQPGDLWQLGRHRLLCADSLIAGRLDPLLADTAADLVLTDPPFAIYGSASGVGADVADDRMVAPFFEAVCRTAHRYLPEFGHCYIHCDWRSYAALWNAARRAHLSPKNCLVWDKADSGLGANYANTHEFIAFFAKLPPPKSMASGRRKGQRTVHKSNVLRFARPTGDDRLHNAAKPVAMLAELIENSTEAGGRVLDLFAGSGSTLIAADQTGRTGLAVDEDPGWCDVICARYQNLTGVHPTCDRLGPVDFLADVT